MFFGLSRTTATEFSFFLALPMISAASLYSLWGARDALSWNDASVLAMGFIAAFISCFVIMRALLKFVSKHSYVAFAWYRIAFGVLILATAYTGSIDWAM
jgi:undecaprenyl-diphosphatase